MTTLTTFEFKAKEGQGNDLLAFFKRILPETRKFQGSKGAQASRLTNDEFIITAYWENESNLGEYLAWREKRGDFSVLLSFLIQAPNIITYTVLEDV
jgi:quinol monooxygenase YgiN